MKKIFSFIVISFVIGNIVSWSMGSWPIEFKQQPYSEQQRTTIDALKKEMSNHAEDASILVELGAIYSMHNDIELANDYLDKAVKLSPNDALAIAWYNANRAKISGASLDFTWGLYKLYTLNTALSNISKAVTMAPDDITIRTIRLATFANIGPINPEFNLVFQDETWFNTLFENPAAQIPQQLKAQFYLSMAQAYYFQENKQAAIDVTKYLHLFKSVPHKTEQDEKQFQQLTTKFDQADRGKSW